jgi:hypothetical protein
MTTATPWTMTKLGPGAYLSRTPVDDRPFLLLSYHEDGSAVDDRGRTIKGTRWAVIVFDDDAALHRAADRAGSLWWDVYSIPADGDVAVASINHRTRYTARAWAETHLDNTEV